MVTLVCGWCGRTRQMWADQWKRYKKMREENGTVLLCEKPSVVRGSKSKCLGVLDEQREN